MKEYQLNVDPRILELLGPNLYTNIYYVLAELIANAYDADAHNVYIVSNEDDIRVEDDGHGMSYENGEVKRFLNVAGVSRSNEGESMTRSGERRKMGRKGVGKLAALSVSESVDVMTISENEKSGFILSRRPIDENNRLQPIPDDEITFLYVQDHGTAIVMKNPQYRLNKSTDSIKRNLLKIFPLVNDDFKIHIVRDDETVTIDTFDENIAKELCAFVSLGQDFAVLANSVPDKYHSRRAELVETRSAYTEPITLKDNEGNEHEYDLKIEGWIGAYASTKGRKATLTDFPDNFISLYANKKMGEFNILPIVGQNKLSEVFVVGQLYVDLFELSELPDMALSNRQGYKSDDPRYIAVIQYVRTLLAEIIRKRSIYAGEQNREKKQRKIEEQKATEAKFREAVDAFRGAVSENAATGIGQLAPDSSKEAIEQVISEAINKNANTLGLKTIIDSQKKKILISHASQDKVLADLIYSFLVFNNVPPEDVLYTSCDDEISRIPEGVASIYNYLRDFFVESYSNQKIFVIFVTSENTPAAWGAMTEIGASWITQVDNKIFNIPPFRPQHPLNDEALWHNTERMENDELHMTKVNADIFCGKIESICDVLGYNKKTREENISNLRSSIVVE